jgi:hypothetical protein
VCAKTPARDVGSLCATLGAVPSLFGRASPDHGRNTTANRTGSGTTGGLGAGLCSNSGRRGLAVDGHITAPGSPVTSRVPSLFAETMPIWGKFRGVCPDLLMVCAPGKYGAPAPIKKWCWNPNGSSLSKILPLTCPRSVTSTTFKTLFLFLFLFLFL